MTRFVMMALLSLSLPLVAQPPADPVRGKAAFMKQGCYTCHGTVGHGGDRGSGPRIAYDVFPWEAFAAAVRRPRQNMPRYSAEQLPDPELTDIYAYIAGQKRGPKASEIPLLRD